MFNSRRAYKTKRLQKLFDFEEFLTLENLEKEGSNLRRCKYISNFNTLYDAFVLFHPMAIVIRIGDKPDKTTIYDKNYFTLFWNRIASLDLKEGS